MLLTLEDVCDQQDFTLSQLTHKNQLGLYKRRKQLELEKVKGVYFLTNKTEHARNMQIHCSANGEGARQEGGGIRGEVAAEFEREARGDGSDLQGRNAAIPRDRKDQS